MLIFAILLTSYYGKDDICNYSNTPTYATLFYANSEIRGFSFLLPRASALSPSPLSVQFATGLNVFRVQLFYVRSAIYL